MPHQRAGGETREGTLRWNWRLPPLVVELIAGFWSLPYFPVLLHRCSVIKKSWVNTLGQVLHLLQGFLWYNVGVCDKLRCTYIIKCGANLPHCAACHIEALGVCFFWVFYAILNCKPDVVAFFIQTENLLYKSFDILLWACEMWTHNVCYPLFFTAIIKTNLIT